MRKLPKIMLSIEKIVVEQCNNSKYIRPFRLSYVQVIYWQINYIIFLIFSK